MSENRWLSTEVMALIDRAPDFVSLSDFGGTIYYLNPAGLDLVGLASTEEACRRTSAEYFTKAGLAEAATIERALSDNGSWQGESELRHFVTHEHIPVYVSSFVIGAHGELPVLIASIQRDRRHHLLQESRLQQALKEADARFKEQQAIADLSRLAIRGSLEDILPAATEAAATLMGVNCAAIFRPPLLGDSLTLVSFSGKADRPLHVPVGAKSQPGYAIATNEVVVCTDQHNEARFCTAGMVARGLASGVAVPVEGDGQIWGALTVHSDQVRAYTEHDVSFLRTIASVISAAIRRVKLETQMRGRSIRDPLTGLPNRRLAHDRITSALNRALVRRTLTAVLLVDFDDFKTINDSYGHGVGDLALVELARRLSRGARPGDTVARLGGDEFVVVCEDIGEPEQAFSITASLTGQLREPIIVEGRSLWFSASIGIALSSTPGTHTSAELIRQADVAMYRAKGDGPGSHALYAAADTARIQRQSAIVEHLQPAIDRNELNLVYQPLFEISTGRIVGVEALTRWQHPTLGRVVPGEFVPVAERHGLIHALGSWALRTACEQGARWQQLADIVIWVNASALQLRQPAFLTEITTVLEATGLPANRLGLEITETEWVQDSSRVRETLMSLHELGVEIALDDLGSGHSSINYLTRYPVIGCFKIDQSYIQSLPGKRSEAIVTAIVALAHAFDVTVVGEGVETEEQLEALRESGCHIAQGFLLARPAPPGEITEMLIRLAPAGRHPLSLPGRPVVA